MTNLEGFSGSQETFARGLLALSKWMKQENIRIVTTQAVLLEIGNSLSKLRHRVAAIRLLEALAKDPRVEIVSLTDSLYSQAVQLFRERPDKEWSLTDCISFCVMSERGINQALTADHHFIQAGYRILLQSSG
jgi:predicted nucleic acid-binding protein